MTLNYNHHKIYKDATHMVPKTKQVVMLFEGVIKHVRQAISAIDSDDVQMRYNSLTKACEIINGLQLSLDFDNGGEIAPILYDYYLGIEMRLMSVHQSNDKAMCEMCIGHLEMMKSAWEEIDHNATSGVSEDEVIRSAASHAVSSPDEEDEHYGEDAPQAGQGGVTFTA